jgi:hypothetical protein
MLLDLVAKWLTRVVVRWGLRCLATWLLGG